MCIFIFFFFQAEDGIRDYKVTGVQTCALPISAANPAPVPWTKEELHSYLRNGMSVLHGTAAGPMSPVVHGLSTLPESDVQAIATYFADIDHAGDRLASLEPAV